MKKLIRNLRIIARKPHLIPPYIKWFACRSAGIEVRRSVHGVSIGGFVDFSEYHSSSRALGRGEAQFLRKLRMREGAIVDIGANIGIISLFLSGLHPDRRVVAIEPSPDTFEALNANVSRSGLNIECFRCADL